MKTYKSANEIAEATKRRESCFIVEGDVANKLIRIKATGPVAWVLCAGSLTIAIGLIISTPAATVATAPAGGVGGVISFTGAGGAAAVAATSGLGTATIAAISLGVAGGGVGVLTAIRDKYKVEKIGKDKIKMTLKN
ncbi:hypothetical protein EDD76_10381 [Kineothrix alysoides]|uniref:Uncharacterized protein n=1 Tax=Kineothrix alysoides TaxID=1469948 RepID=A0A4R1R3J9_9FIRM|nr:hypothetical protein [Kineothrix alysoides]TCL59892.1 hypothetical protein EDD76_10381 [Kineothrix alysoides]